MEEEYLLTRQTSDQVPKLILENKSNYNLQFRKENS